MKKRTLKPLQRVSLIMIACVGLALELGAQPIPKEYLGDWKTDLVKVTVRKKVSFLKYQFSSCKVTLTLKIESENNIIGTIGDARFRNATIKKNKGNPEENGIAYIIDCGAINKIFIGDSSGLKKIELWVKPIKQAGEIIAEIRLRDGWDVFPMGEGVFTRNK